MNCQKGDLAVLIRSTAGNEGAVMRCLEFGNFCHQFPDGSHRTRPCWRMDRSLRGWNGLFCEWAADEDLRPIRADGITDSEVSELFSPSPAKESEKV